MGLIETLRKAEEQGRGAARRGLEKARDVMDDAERRLRRKMRLHPRTPPPEPRPLPISVSPPVSSNAAVAEKTLAHRASEEDAA
jgi:hypothetical protein